MTPAETAEARAAGYRLLAALIAGPLTADLVAAAAIDPRLQTDRPLDDLGAEHMAAFDQGSSPHAGVFLEDEPSLGGPRATACADLWRRIGLPEERWTQAPDHLASHLSALAWLCGAEADAHTDGVSTDGLTELQAEVLDALLAWLPRQVVAVIGGWTGALASVIGELVVHHRLALGQPRTHDDLGDALDVTDPATGIGDIAAFLTAPHRCGFLLTRHALQDVGRALELPAGFGPRRQRLGTMLRSAARFDRWEALLDALDARVTQAGTALEGAPWAALGLPPDPRLLRTREVLRALQSAGGDLLGEG